MAQFGQILSFGNYKKAIFNLIKTHKRRPPHADSRAGLRPLPTSRKRDLFCRLSREDPPRALYNTVVCNAKKTANKLKK